MSVEIREQGHKGQRRFRNFLLQPIIQLRIAAWAALVAALFSLAIAMLFNWALVNIADSYMEIGHLDDAQIAQTHSIFESVRLWALGLLLAQVAASVTTAILTTHRMVGPTVAFRQQIRALINGHFGRKLTLRNGDAFSEVADDLNELSMTLQRDSGKSSESPAKSDKKFNAINS
jgi:hypothetical protein